MGSPEGQRGALDAPIVPLAPRGSARHLVVEISNLLKVVSFELPCGSFNCCCNVLPSRAGAEDMGERQPLPLYPLHSLTPFVAGPAGPDPGLGARSTSLTVKRTLSGRGDDTARGLR